MRTVGFGRIRSLARIDQRQAPSLKPTVGLFDQACTPVWYSRNQNIFGDGEPAEYFYKIKSGCVRTCKTLDDGRRQIGSFYFPGDVFGLESSEEHSISAEAVTRCKLLVTKRKLAMSRAAESNAILRQLLVLTNLELQNTQRHIVLLLKTAQERVVSFLLEMEKNKHAEGGIDLPMPRQDIADYLGLTIETVSRQLKRLEHASTISMPTARHVVVRDRSMLDLLY